MVVITNQFAEFLQNLIDSNKSPYRLAPAPSVPHPPAAALPPAEGRACRALSAEQSEAGGGSPVGMAAAQPESLKAASHFSQSILRFIGNDVICWMETSLKQLPCVL